MPDDASLKQMRIVLAQVRATEHALREVDAGTIFHHSNATFLRVNSLITQAKTVLQGTGLEKSVPQEVSPPSMRTGVIAADLNVAVANLAATLVAALEDQDGELPALREEVDSLKSQLAGAEVRSLDVVDDELRDRCLDLLMRPDKADTAVREATVILEDRIRRIARLGTDSYGVGLVDKALNPKTGSLHFGRPQREREGLHQLYRGAIGFFKNPASHRIIEDYDVARARQVVGLIDLLLFLLRDAKNEDENADSAVTATPST